MFCLSHPFSLCGLQDAKKGVLFDDFPPVLQLQLKRFEYDFNRDAMMKVWTLGRLSPVCQGKLRIKVLLNWHSLHGSYHVFTVGNNGVVVVRCGLSGGGGEGIEMALCLPPFLRSQAVSSLSLTCLCTRPVSATVARELKSLAFSSSPPSRTKLGSFSPDWSRPMAGKAYGTSSTYD